MVTAEELSYKYIDVAGKGIQEIKSDTLGSILIWVTGSAYYDKVTPSKYECVLEYKGHTKYLTKEIEGKTANGIMVEGIISAAECINKASNVIVISANSLGIHKAFKGTGPNALIIQEFFKILKEKECTFTEARYTNGVDLMKKYIKLINQQ